jgi:two-component system sensor histidine kinase KdpD
MLFLFAVLTSALLWGLRPSLFAALLSAGASAFFFYPPIYSFGVESHGELVDLTIFSVIALATIALATETRRQRQEAEDVRFVAKTEELREAVLNSISHDLQTPLASIIGSVTALRSFGGLYDGAAREDLIATIEEEAERLERFINNVLDLTRIRAGQITPRFEVVELADIVESALRKVERDLVGHDVRVELPEELPMLSVDLFLMEHALLNVLTNAGKYSPKGTQIRISARRVDDVVHLEVADSGAGISADDLPHVFDQFYRGGLNDARNAGTGLGLAICRAFVEANHGSVEVASAGVGKGATFRFVLPATEAPTTDLAASDE